ncbi:hypothetical protein [Viscerimonas tarda]
MVIERTSNEYVIRVPITSNIEYIQDVIDYLRYKELTGSYSTLQPEVGLPREIPGLPRTAKEIILSVTRGMEQYRQGKGISHVEFLKEQETWK